MKKENLSDAGFFVIAVICGAFLFYVSGMPGSDYSNSVAYSVGADNGTGAAEINLDFSCSLNYLSKKINSQCAGYNIHKMVYGGEMDAKKFCSDERFKEFSGCSEIL